MNGTLTIRTTILGILSWLVPFVISFVFFDRTGQVMVPQVLFKSIMVVVGGGTGVVLLVIAYRHLFPTFKSGLLLGCYWLVINWVLDVAILVPFTHMPVAGYFYDIGLRYLLLPIISAGMGFVAENSGRKLNP